MNDKPTGGSAVGRLLGGGPKTGTIPAGTAVAVNMTSRVCTNTHKLGATVYSTTTATVNGTNGAVIPAGSQVTLTVLKGWHINANPAADENSIPTEVTAESVSGIPCGPAVYPRPRIEKLSFSDQPLLVFEGNALDAAVAATR